VPQLGADRNDAGEKHPTDTSARSRVSALHSLRTEVHACSDVRDGVAFCPCKKNGALGGRQTTQSGKGNCRVMPFAYGLLVRTHDSGLRYSRSQSPFPLVASALVDNQSE
jgi:hypothetical protein